MKNEYFNFNFNGEQHPLPLTMQAAIDKCREAAINKKQTTVLAVRSKRGTWAYLGTYEPNPESPIPYTIKCKDGTKLTAYIDACLSDPAVPKYQH